jgi:glycosyltransferase involved in cell wall biosynthesis
MIKTSYANSSSTTRANMNTKVGSGSPSNLTSLIQISAGDIPSQAAHTMQITKMAEAFAQQVDSFELITAGDLWSWLTRTQLDLKQWYGLQREFALVRLPTQLKQQYPLPPHAYGGAFFYVLAAFYAWLKSPTLVYTRTPAVAIALLKLQVPVMWELHEPAKDYIFNQRTLNHKNLVGFVTISAQFGQIAIDKGLPPEKLLIEPSAVDLAKFSPAQTKAQARAQIGWQRDRPIITYSGHLHDHKGIPTILALAQLMPDCDFMLVGGWPNDVDRVRQASQSQGLSNVHLIGHVNQAQLPNYLYAADVLILPTSASWELAQFTSPLKLFDYMAAQRPIVASNLPNISAIAQDRVNALLATPDQANSFKGAIEQLITNPNLSKNLSQTLSQQAWQTVQAYTWDQRASRILAFAQTRLCH